MYSLYAQRKQAQKLNEVPWNTFGKVSLQAEGKVSLLLYTECLLLQFISQVRANMQNLCQEHPKCDKKKWKA